ncbi:hypothetical protein BOTBODRAFT_177429 [Botryobasidium botryosum FD-172 SS1]|uniref:Uncharacterized protein n=1 Tax=Botryobasidium botryosum (strain FD-172 SS1) TaxID=930990 RepID=A0A067MIM2_BOTB1|nr:hypothetical protein BOTBODRAFT_177429 [Botryobasidium botryosum FD-172 SS1]
MPGAAPHVNINATPLPAVYTPHISTPYLATAVPFSNMASLSSKSQPHPARLIHAHHAHLNEPGPSSQQQPTPTLFSQSQFTPTPFSQPHFTPAPFSHIPHECYWSPQFVSLIVTTLTCCMPTPDLRSAPTQLRTPD